MADMLNGFEFRFGDAHELSKRLLTRYEEVTTQQVVKRSAALLGSAHLTVQVVPKGAAK
jgi:hypothetical protein